MKLQNKFRVVVSGLVLSLVSSSLLASGGQRGERRGPPPEAIEACASLSLEQACSFTSQRRSKEVSGICVLRKDDDSQLACKPEKGSRGKGGERGSRESDETTS